MPNFRSVLDSPLTEEIKLTIYRIVQEALTNIAKHSQPTEVNLKVQTFPQFLHLSIEDNGQGFNPEQNTTGFGLQGMKERVIALDGSIKILSSFGCGEYFYALNNPELLSYHDPSRLNSNRTHDVADGDEPSRESQLVFLL